MNQSNDNQPKTAAEQIATEWAKGKRVFVTNQAGDVIASGPAPKATE